LPLPRMRMCALRCAADIRPWTLISGSNTEAGSERSFCRSPGRSAGDSVSAQFQYYQRLKWHRTGLRGDSETKPERLHCAKNDLTLQFSLARKVSSLIISFAIASCSRQCTRIRADVFVPRRRKLAQQNGSLPVWRTSRRVRGFAFWSTRPLDIT